MSYHTHVDIQISDDINPEAVLSLASKYLGSQGIYAVDEILQDLGTALAEGSSLFNGLACEDFEGLMRAVSASTPSVTFYVRGMGEEFADVWLRQFLNGKVRSPIGPFDIEV